MGKKKDKKGRKSKNNQLSAEKQFQTEIKNIIEKIILKRKKMIPIVLLGLKQVNQRINLATVICKFLLMNKQRMLMYTI